MMLSSIINQLSRGQCHDPRRPRDAPSAPPRPPLSRHVQDRYRLALEQATSTEVAGLNVQIRPIINVVQATLINQAALAGNDPAVEAAVSQLVESLAPALQVAAMEIAEQAAAEVRAQLVEQTVDVVLSDGQPTLRVGDPPRTGERPGSAEDLDARITLRLTPTLKQLVEDAAQTAGDSVNAWVVDALGRRANQRGRGAKKTHNESFDL
jgi:hypothetical protein